MKFLLLKTRFIAYVILFLIIIWFLFNFLLNTQGAIMYRYFIEKPSNYNLERAERLASSIYQSFKKEISSPSLENILGFIEKYNGIPFLSVNFIYQDTAGIMQSVLQSAKTIDILSAEYVYPIKYGDKETGTLIIYDINKEYKKGLKEYDNIINLTRLFFAILLFLLLSLLVSREYSLKIGHLKRLAEYEAVHDGLTGLYTQKYFKESLEKEIERARRYNYPLSLIMCDIDHFKEFNDSYGHIAGDKAIRGVAGIIKNNVRSSDIVARYGGEEFAVLLLETGETAALTIAKRLKSLTAQAVDIAVRIKEKVQKTPIAVENAQKEITLSIGISTYTGNPDFKAEYFISEADRALYESKTSGRNLITLFDPVSKKFISNPENM